MKTHPLCRWLVLLQDAQQPIPQAHPVFQKRLLSQPCIFNLWQPQTSLANSKQLLCRKSSTPLATTCLGTSLADSFAFSHAKYPNYDRVSLTGNHATSSLHSPFFSCYSTLISQFSLMLRTPKSTGSSRTVQTGDLIQITSQPGFSKNVRPYSSLQSPTLDKEELPIMIIIFFSNSVHAGYSTRYFY